VSRPRRIVGWRRAALLVVRFYPNRFRVRTVSECERPDFEVFVDALRVLGRAWADQIRSHLSIVQSPRPREHLMSVFMHDVRFAIRHLVRRPAFFAAAALTLGLGIGANTSIFSVVNGILLRPLPYPQPDRLVNVWQVNEDFRNSPNPWLRGWADRFPASMPIINDWVELAPHVFDGVGGFASTIAIRRGDDRPEEVLGVRTTSGVWKALNVPPLMGRALLPDDDRIGAPPVAILAHGYWQRTFGGDSGVVGRTIEFDQVAHTIIGVMPAEFYFPNDNQQFWSSFPDDDKQRPRDSQFLQAIARLRHGTAFDAAVTELNAVTQQIVEATGGDHRETARIVPRIDEVVGDVRAILLVLLGAVGIVLLISCANIASLLLVRATERRRELAIRAALGAHRGRLVRQLFTESLVLGVIGGIIGVVIGGLTLQPLVAMMPPETPRLDEIALDHRVMVFSMLLTLTTSLLVGVLPAITSTRTHAARALQDSSRTATAGRRRITTQGSLVVAEVALAFVLLLGGGVLAKSFVSLINVDRGFDETGIATLRVLLRGPYIDDVDRRRVFVDQLMDRLSGMPGVRAVSLADHMPIIGGTNSGSITVDIDGELTETNAERGVVEAGYFRTMGIRVLSGVEFSAENRHGTEPVVIVSRNFAEQFWPNGALGKRLRFGAREATENDWRTVVGVVGDVRHQSLESEPVPKVYVPYDQSPQRYFTLALALGDAPTEGLATAIRNAVWELEPGIPLDDVATMAAGLSRSVASPRFRMVLVVSLAGLAGVLAIVGIYGVLAFSVSQRTAEIGIRIALGADQRRVLSEVVLRGLTLSVLGLAIGFAIATITVRVLEDFLFETPPLDPFVLAAVTVTLVGAGLAASYLPARRALRVDPVQALRAE